MRYIYTIALIAATTLLAFANTPKNVAQPFEQAIEEYDPNHYESPQQLDSTIVRMEEALLKVEKYSSRYERILEFLGMAYMDKEDNANANRILGLMEEHNRHELTKECDTPECYLERAEYYKTTGQTANAKEEYMGAFALSLTAEQKVNAYHQYARFLASQSDYAQAAEYYAMAAAASLAADGESEFATYLYLQAGLSYCVAKEYVKAIDAHSKVIANVEKYGYSEKLKSHSLRGLGNAYSGMKDHPKSIETFKLWIEHLRANGHENDADGAKAYERLASEEKIHSDYDAAIADYETAISLYDKLGMNDQAEQARAGLKTCLLYADRNPGESVDNVAAERQRSDELREIIRTSINFQEQVGDYLGSLSKARTLATIASSYAELKDYANAIDYYSQYISSIRSALAEDFLLKNPKERELTWRKELTNIQEMNALITNLPNGTPDLYSRLSNLMYDGQLLSKGILLSSNIEFDKALNRHGTPEMKSQYHQIKANLLEIEKMRQAHSPIEDIQSKARENDALQLALAREAASNGLYTDFLKYTVADVAGALESDEAAIEFIVLHAGILPQDELIVAIVVTKEFPSGITIPICPIKYINAMIADKDKFSNDNYTAQIWGGIMQVAHNKKRIYFAPDGVLNNVGIEYLTLNGTPIDEIVEMSRLSSTREICREHPALPLQQAVLFGDIDYSGTPGEVTDKSTYRKAREADELSFVALENTAREVSEISRILKSNVKKSTVTPYTGSRASKAEFLSQEELPINLLHIATHGKYFADNKTSDTDAMDNSILVFAGANLYDEITENEGIVTAAEIADMSLHDCQLVVLSACESGLGKLGDDGVFGLQRGFKNAGVKSLLVSLNEVADEATADMMISFYRHLVSPGTSKQAAFKKARSEIRTKYPADSTWASFILIDSFD